MPVSAIVLAGVALPTQLGNWHEPVRLAASAEASMVSEVACMEVLGRSFLQRTLDRLTHAGLDFFTVLVGQKLFRNDGPLTWMQPGPSLEVEPIQNEIDIVPAIERGLFKQLSKGFTEVFLVSLNTYTEFDPGSVCRFARDLGDVNVRLHDQLGAVGTWLFNAERSGCVSALLEEIEVGRRSDLTRTYMVDGYVNRLSDMGSLRRFVVDAFMSRCAARPGGTEVRPGVWLQEGVQLDKQVRFVPPVYVGRNSRIGSDTVITRCSNIERDCFIDYGTVVEDSSVLACTYVGTGLDVAHSVVCGNLLVHLRQNLAVEINDQVLIGNNMPSRLRQAFASRAK